MVLDRLTENAIELIAKLADLRYEGTEEVSAKKVLTCISKSEGLGSTIIKDIPDIKVKARSRIDINHLIKESYYQASRLDHPYVGTEHFLLALLKISESKDFDTVKTHVNSVNLFPKAISLVSDKRENVILDTFGRNLTKESLFAYREPLIFREEINSLVSILLKKENASPLLVGEPGVGKKSLIQLLVRNIASLDVPPIMAGYQVIEFDLMRYITSVVNKGNMETSLFALQDELKSLNRVILSIKNFQNLFMSTNIGISIPVLYPLFREIMENTNINFIATMNSSVYHKLSLDNDHLLENFTPLDVEEPNEEVTRRILKLKAESLSDYHNIKISDELIDYIYSIAKTELPGSQFPKKGVDLLDIACANLQVKKSRVPKEYKKLVDETILLYETLDNNLSSGDYDKAQLVENKINATEKKLSAHEDKMIYSKPLKLSKKSVDVALKEMEYVQPSIENVQSAYLGTLAKKIKKELIGQDEAVDSVVKSLIRSNLGLRPKNKPVGSFLFLGPTGVGKTELAKVLAKNAFGDSERNHLIRLDMSDFAEKHTVARLVGSPPGYVGYGEGGELTSKIEAVPNSVVLFDEIEKAHPDVLNILLQIMDEGELSDAKGNRFSFSEAIIVLTSNLGTEILHKNDIGFVDRIEFADDNKVSEQLKLNLKKILKPELLNRFDEVIVFRQLTKEDQLRVLDVLLVEVENSLREQEVYINVTKKGKDYLIKKGYSKEYGARALRRTIERELLDRIADILLVNKDRPLFLTAKDTKEGFKVISKK